MKIVVSLMLFLSFGHCAYSWEKGGQEIVASIAFQSITPEVREKLAQIIKYHPFYKKEFEPSLPEDLQEDPVESLHYYFTYASRWPLLALNYKGNDRRYKQKKWFYIGHPFFWNDEDRKNYYKKSSNKDQPVVWRKGDKLDDFNLLQALHRARIVLESRKFNKAEKAIALSWASCLFAELTNPLSNITAYSKPLIRYGDRNRGTDIFFGKDSRLRDWTNSLYNEYYDFGSQVSKAKRVMSKPKYAEYVKSLEEKPISHKEVVAQSKISYDMAVQLIYSEIKPITLIEKEYKGRTERDDYKQVEYPFSEDLKASYKPHADLHLIRGGALLAKFLSELKL